MLSDQRGPVELLERRADDLRRGCAAVVDQDRQGELLIGGDPVAQCGPGLDLTACRLLGEDRPGLHEFRSNALGRVDVAAGVAAEVEDDLGDTLVEQSLECRVELVRA